ncbi:hypothetical protein NRK67_05500 [Fusobacteria bacterium ZRK30]|nr:hypothetical protein NRK67_05500 [Fusobacteria bacterium ZRK30]
MLIAIYALLSWLSIFDSGDVNNEAGKVKKEQNVKIINGDEKNYIAASRNINNNFLNQDRDSYGLELYCLYNNMEKEKDYGIYSNTSHLGYIDESKKNKTWIGGSCINKEQGFLIDVLDNTFVPTIGIEYKSSPSMKVLGEEYFKERVKK